jgi:hypothetical protein
VSTDVLKRLDGMVAQPAALWGRKGRSREYLRANSVPQKTKMVQPHHLFLVLGTACSVSAQIVANSDNVGPQFDGVGGVSGGGGGSRLLYDYEDAPKVCMHAVSTVVLVLVLVWRREE